MGSQESDSGGRSNFTLAGIRLVNSPSLPFFFGLYQNGSPSCYLYLSHSLPLNFKALTRKTDLEYSANLWKQGKLIPKSQESFKTESKQQKHIEREERT